MAMHAAHFLVSRCPRELLVHQGAVAAHASVLQDTAVLVGHHDGLMEVLQRECRGVAEAVFALGEILADKAVRQVAVDAGGDAVVAGLLPAVVLRLHDVAVDAHLRIVAHVREAFGIQKGEAADAGQKANEHRQNHRRASHAFPQGDPTCRARGPAVGPWSNTPTIRPVLEARDLECERGGKKLFRQLGFALAPGETLRIAGPNGSGKTSLLRILCGLLTPTAGEVLWNGARIQSLKEDYARHVLYLGHAPAVKDELTAAENLRAAC